MLECIEFLVAENARSDRPLKYFGHFNLNTGTILVYGPIAVARLVPSVLE